MKIESRPGGKDIDPPDVWWAGTRNFLGSQSHGSRLGSDEKRPV